MDLTIYAHKILNRYRKVSLSAKNKKPGNLFGRFLLLIVLKESCIVFSFVGMVKNSSKQATAHGRAGLFTKPKGRGKKRTSFLEDLPHIMYGFGDVPEPIKETKELLNQMVCSYIREFTVGAVEVARETDGSGSRRELDEHCMMCRIKSQQKRQRAVELLRMHEELKDAQKLDLFEKNAQRK
jgi:transcription initiation factor TFIID subunit 13